MCLQKYFVSSLIHLEWFYKRTTSGAIKKVLLSGQDHRGQSDQTPVKDKLTVKTGMAAQDFSWGWNLQGKDGTASLGSLVQA